jgi:polar amino acid transport system substrate-binding protein
MSDKLGFEIEYSLVDFAGQLAGVQAGRYDLGICDFYWTTDRVPRGVFTDPIAYTPVQVVQEEGGEVNTVKGFEGKNLGSIIGYSWNPALKAVPGANVRLFPEPPALLADVAAGRIDVAPADPLVTQAAIDERPEWKLEVQDLTPPTAEELAAHPEYKLLRPSQIAWYAAKGQDELADALTEQIREMYADGTLAELLEKYGGSASWLVPPGDYIAEERRGLDRPEDWEPPSTE